MTPTEQREVVKFTPNVPVEVALKFAGQGKIISTRLGERVMYTLTDDRVMFLDLRVAQKINELGVNVREKFFLCKPSGSNKGADWTVWLAPETENNRAAAKAGQLQPPEEETPLLRQLQGSIDFVKADQLGEVGNGTFVVQAGASIVASFQADANEHGTVLIGIGHSHAGNGNGGTSQSVRSPNERGETMEPNGHAVAGALTPATVQAVALALPSQE